jgi:hypothetical protein
MIVKTRAQVLDEAGRLDIHGSATAKMHGAFLGLYTAGPTPNVGSLLSNFTEATFTGYSRQPLTWSAPINEPDGSASVIGSLSQFNLSATTTLNTVTGALVIANDSVTLLGAESFAGLINLVNVGDGFGYVAKINTAFQPDDSAGTVIV